MAVSQKEETETTAVAAVAAVKTTSVVTKHMGETAEPTVVVEVAATQPTPLLPAEVDTVELMAVTAVRVESLADRPVKTEQILQE